MLKTITEINVRASSATEQYKTFYAYADNTSKTWYVTQTKRAPYKGLILLFELGCLGTSKSIHHPDKSMPVVGTILNSVVGERLEVMQCDWV